MVFESLAPDCVGVISGVDGDLECDLILDGDLECDLILDGDLDCDLIRLARGRLFRRFRRRGDGLSDTLLRPRRIRGTCPGKGVRVGSFLVVGGGGVR